MTREELLRHARAMYECSLTPENVKSALEKEFPELKENEDERIIRFFSELATNACGGPGQEYYEELGLNYDKVMTWLESKKEQKHAEWSERDKELIDIAVAAVENFYARRNPIRAEVINFIKSLRPSWKPSKEQMEALKCAVNDSIMQYDYKASPLKEEVTRTYSENLQSLLDDLNKL